MWNRSHIHSVHPPQQDALGLPTVLGSDVFDLSQFESAAGWNLSIHSIHSILNASAASAPRVEAMTSRVDQSQFYGSHLRLPPIGRSRQTHHPEHPSKSTAKVPDVPNAHGPKPDIPGPPERCPAATVNPSGPGRFPHESPQGREPIQRFCCPKISDVLFDW